MVTPFAMGSSESAVFYLIVMIMVWNFQDPIELLDWNGFIKVAGKQLIATQFAIRGSLSKIRGFVHQRFIRLCLDH
jgi:hypothetical protein